MESVGDIDFGAFDALTFDCYGTLIDWETGILSALRPVLERHGASRDDDTLLELFAHHEAALEAGPYLSYKAVLAGALRGIGTDLNFEPTEQEQATFGVSVNDWPAFADSPAALAQLKQRFKLGVITNCDDDLFAASNAEAADRVRLGHHRAAGRGLQAADRELRVRVRAHRRPAGAHPARRAVALPRPRARQGAGHDHGLDRPARRAARAERPRRRRPCPT